jgi:hypothetical protein
VRTRLTRGESSVERPGFAASRALGCLLAAFAGWRHRGLGFLTLEVLTLRGVVRYHVLVVIDLASRWVEIDGIACEPLGAWVMHVVRNLHGQRRWLSQRKELATPVSLE